MKITILRIGTFGKQMPIPLFLFVVCFSDGAKYSTEWDTDREKPTFDEVYNLLTKNGGRDWKVEWKIVSISATATKGYQVYETEITVSEDEAQRIRGIFCS